MNDPVYLALDVDGTLTTQNLSYQFGRFLYQNKLISLPEALLAGVIYGLHTFGLCSVSWLHRSLFALLFKGKSGGVIEEAADRFLAASLPALFREAVVQEVKARQRHGAIVGLFSSSPDFLVRRVAQAVGAQEWFATQYQLDSKGQFSRIGRIVSGKEKADYVRQMGLQFLVAMSDSFLDVPLLLEADEAIVVCPDRRLARLARLKGWRRIE